MYCKKCGSELREDAVFCLECGTQVKQTINADIHNISETEKTTNKKKVLIPVLGCGVIALVVVIAVIFGMKKSKDEPVASTETVEQENAEEVGSIEKTEEEIVEETTETEEPKLILTKEVSYGSDGNPSGSYEYEYDSQGNTIKKIGYDRYGNMSTYEEWDSLGNELKRIRYTEDGLEKQSEIHEYDEHGNILKWIKGADLGVDYYCTYEYDEQGNLLSCVQDSVYDDDYSIEYTYDDDGNCIKKVYRKPRDYVEEYEYFYDDLGRLTYATTHQYDNEYNYETETKYEYDENGNKISVVESNLNGSVIRRSNYEYLENGEQRKYIVYDGDGNIIEWDEDIYDNDGKLIESIYYERLMANLDYKTEYTYDSNGYLIKEMETSRNLDGTLDYINNIEYTNDSSGNVMKKTIQHKSYHYSEDGDSVYQSLDVKEYNEEGVLIKWVTYDEEGRIENLYEYDNYGNLIKESHPNMGYGSYLTCEYKYEYDEYGNVLKVTNYTDGETDGYTEYGYENIEEYTKKREMYKAILDNALTEQENTGDLSILKYQYLFYDFNQDGSDEILLRKTEYHSVDTIYIYSLVNNEIKLIAERSDGHRYEEISALMMNGIVVEGTVTNGCEYHHYIYEIKENGMDLLADFHSYEYAEDVSNYEMNIEGETITTTDRAEYENIVNKYLEENVAIKLSYNSVRWNTLY